MKHLQPKRRKKLREQNIRAFTQKGLLGLMQTATSLGVPDARGYVCLELGSGSIIDPEGHIARMKQAMGITPSATDALFAYLGDNHASLYVGFLPGQKPSRVHPQIWLHRFVRAMPRMHLETLRFVDALFLEMMRITMAIGRTHYPEPELESVPPITWDELLPHKERTLH